MLRGSLRLPRACCKGFQPPAHSFLWPQTVLPHFVLSNPIPCSPPVAALCVRLGRAEADALLLLDRAALGLTFPWAPKLHSCWGWPRAGGTVESVPVPPDTGATPVQPHCAAEAGQTIARPFSQFHCGSKLLPGLLASRARGPTSEARFSACLDQAWSLQMKRGGVSAPAPDS